ncbi:L-rhamnose mutarotase [Sunxiuqinia sp. sy24]|uniref:L-rhamnose mutarotase n=1 Tax=Sunxiuqinia sp. sy24 TaxID=3461495 RepID=UPI004046528E
MSRLACKMYLNEGQKAEYKKRHNEIWPELKKLLKDSGVSDYSIFLDEETNTLFAFQQINGESCSQEFGQSDIVQRWWNFIADIMQTTPDNSPISIPLEEVFYMK